MSQFPEQNNNTDLPRPRNMQDFSTQKLPELKRREPEPESPKTQEFPIPELHKVETPVIEAEIPVPPRQTPQKPVSDYGEYSHYDQKPIAKKKTPPPKPRKDEDSGYGAYEEYDRPDSVSKKHSSSGRSSSNSSNSNFSNSSHSSRKKKPQKKHRHGGGFLRKLFRKIFAFVLVIFILYSAVAFLLIRQLENIPRGTRTVTNGSLAQSYVRNVLLIGTDARDIQSERGRSDTVLLLSLNSSTKQIYLTSFMRDAYVEIPNYGYDKLNSAYAYGGAELLMDTLELNYQISIDDYCMVSFMGFAEIIDAFGGVEITLSDEEAQALNIILQSEVNQLAGDDPSADLLPQGGTYLLNGKQALSYSRIRYVGNADFERTSRQREVMSQLFQKAKSNPFSAVPKLVSSAMPQIGTNMNDFELYLLSLRVPIALSYDIQQMRIPADGTYSPQSVDGQDVLQVDFNANRQILQDTVYATSAN